MWELYALEQILKIFKEKSGIIWNTFVEPYNSDLVKFNSCQILQKYKVRIYSSLKQASWTVFGFKSDLPEIPNVHNIFNVYSINGSSEYPPPSLKKSFDIVVSNVKLQDKKPELECSSRMWDILSNLPYSVAVVPRHPCTEDFLATISIPQNTVVINDIWVVRDLCSSCQLVIMWLLFSNAKWEYDHNPFEATIASNALYGADLEHQPEYNWFYTESWLLHPVVTPIEIPDLVWRLIKDDTLNAKLKKRNLMISSNRTNLKNHLTQKLWIQ